jgi:excisionase family DNA binding protein
MLILPARPEPHRQGVNRSGGRPERYLTVSEAATFLNTSERFVRRLVAERRVAFHHVGRHVRFAVSDLEAFVRAGRVEPINLRATGRSCRTVS